MILAVAVAQIDPLSVASVMGHKRLSDRARTGCRPPTWPTWR